MSNLDRRIEKLARVILIELTEDAAAADPDFRWCNFTGDLISWKSYACYAETLIGLREGRIPIICTNPDKGV